MSRFLLWDSPIAYPFYDLATLDNSGPVFDMNVILEDYNGSVFIKAEHVVEMARTIGMATVDDVAVMRARIAELENQVNNLPVALEGLKGGIDNHIADFYVALSAPAPIPVDAEPEAVPVDEDSDRASDSDFLDLIAAERETSNPFSF